MLGFGKDKKKKTKNTKPKSVKVKQTNKKQNKSKTPLGRTFQTKDNYFIGQQNKPPKNRRVVVIEINENDEFGVVGMTTQNNKNSTKLSSYAGKNNKNVYYKHYLEVQDDEGKPIKRGNKFRENHKNNDVLEKDVESIRKKLYDKKTSSNQRNKKRRDWLHNRKRK